MTVNAGEIAILTCCRWRSPLAMLAVVTVLLGGCATFEPRPLQERALSPISLESFQIESIELNSGAAAAYKVDLSDGLDLTEIGIVAVINNPDLKAQRALLNVAAAQTFAAGLLPDPQLVAGFEEPTGNSATDTAWALGLNYDIIPLITRQATLDAGRGAQDRVRLDLLWQEWQVMQQARSLAVRLQSEQQQLGLLHKMHSLYLARYQRSAQALHAGDITLDINGADLTALVDVLSQINQLEQVHNDTTHSFNLLLGLSPKAIVVLAPLPPAEALDAPEVNSRLARLPELRPDLLALRAGYDSQEALLRAAILAQFPSLGIGINRARDTSNVDTLGLSITLSLPLFSGNRGNIAIERATREQLYHEYQARLAQADADVDRLLELQALLQAQLESLNLYLPTLETLVVRAGTAYQKGDINVLMYLNMESTLMNKRLEQLSLQQSCWENRIALEVLLAMPGYPQTPLPIPIHTEGAPT